MFYGNRVEKYEYELLTLQAGRYESAGLLDNVSSARISMDFAREVVCNATFSFERTGEINYLTDRIRPYYCMGGKRWPLGTYLPDHAGENSRRQAGEAGSMAHDPSWRLWTTRLTLPTPWTKERM